MKTVDVQNVMSCDQSTSIGALLEKVMELIKNSVDKLIEFLKLF